jgi:perosamine synthetase
MEPADLHLRHPIPRMPVFGWRAFEGAKTSALPCVLDLPNLRYTTSGRAAILLSLEALAMGQVGAAKDGTGTKPEVLLPTYHCPSMVAPVLLRGWQPRTYPITADGAPDMAWLDQQDLGHARVLLVVHFFGLPQPMARWRQWCDARGIVLIEDCAHAMFGSSDGRPIGSWGDVAIASLTKFLPVVEGGCLIVNKPPALSAQPALQRCGMGTRIRCAVDIAEVGARHGRLVGLNQPILGALAGMKALRGLSQRDKLKPTSAPQLVAPPDGLIARPRPSHADVSDDFSIDLAKAHRALAWPCQQLALTLPRQRIAAQRLANYRTLAQALAGYAGLHALRPKIPPDCAPYVFPLWVDQPDPAYLELRRLGLPVLRWDRLWQTSPAVLGDQGTRWSNHVLQLSCHQDLRPAELAQLVKTLLRLYANSPALSR